MQHRAVLTFVQLPAIFLHGKRSNSTSTPSDRIERLLASRRTSAKDSSSSESLWHALQELAMLSGLSALYINRWAAVLILAKVLRVYSKDERTSGWSLWAG